MTSGRGCCVGSFASPAAREAVDQDEERDPRGAAPHFAGALSRLGRLRQGRPASLAELELAIDERETVEAGLRQLDFLETELAHIDRTIAEQALGSPEIWRLMTIPGVDVTTAAALMATIGDISRFESPRHLAGYLGLDPKLRQSGVAKPRRGHISTRC